MTACVPALYRSEYRVASVDASWRTRFSKLFRDENSKATVEYSVLFALMAILVFSAAAILVRNVHNAACAAVVIRANSSLEPEFGNASTIFERHYSVPYLAKQLGYCPNKVQKWFKDTNGCLVDDYPETMHKRGYISMRVPESIAKRIYAEHITRPKQAGKGVRA